MPEAPRLRCGVADKQPRDDVAAGSRQVGREQPGARAVASHHQPEQDQAERGIGRQVPDVGMEPHGSEEPPPLAVRHRRAVHDTGGLEVAVRAEPDRTGRPGKPRPGCPNQTGCPPRRHPAATAGAGSPADTGGVRAAPVHSPAAGHQQAPAPAVLGVLDGGFNALTDKTRLQSIA